MNTSILEEAQNIKVRFHVGRGGRFNNAGHKTYVGTVNDLSDCFGDCFVFSEDENGKPLPDSKWQLVDGGGNVMYLDGEQPIFYCEDDTCKRIGIKIPADIAALCNEFIHTEVSL